MNTTNKIYTGIGSRETPTEVCKDMTRLADILARSGWTLRSGAAAGADAAFERGAGDKKEIYVPWPGFGGSQSDLYKLTPEAMEIAAKYHPAWENCGNFARAFHTRNVYQVLGYDLQTPTNFILCWHQNSGGTLQACRIAEAYGIPIFNMALKGWKNELVKFLEENFT